ncbi:squamous cell carcinoma antigen recognized by T-cells 3 isoform X2 [Amblyraja radiata]|uniref:squamous cell carcinoma antigen recognized by T-cells 3 isoform X2 n=1 Tax=Amblyraja radiata TaxID=386614 RepID=UPI001403AE8C|nr:squamous cell carcinoma antigen recognized by T-cells 3 isoform X2 [Amblyraja radiata]
MEPGDKNRDRAGPGDKDRDRAGPGGRDRAGDRDSSGDEEEMEPGDEETGAGDGAGDGDEAEADSGSGEEMDDSSDDEQENEAEIQRLEEQLSISAYDYNCHIDLIKLLRQEGELVKLRCARQTMSELFPLTEELWLDWLKDEIRMAEKPHDREKVYELFEKAIKDYICPEIWLEYAQYSIGGIGLQGGIERARGIFDRALTAVGLHMTKGVAIWEAFREFENAILGTLQALPGTIVTPDQQEAMNKQLDRVHALFKRQLAIPLLDMESTYAEYEEWADEVLNESVKQFYKKALQQMEKRKPFEEALLAADPPKLAEYQAYIDFEVKDGDPARIQITFERTLSENCLVPDLWARYTVYLDRKLKIKDVVLSAHERAVRNCPWIVGLWKRYILALERHQVEHKIVTDTFEKALNAGFIQATDYVELWQAFLDYLRRRVDFSEDSSKELEELRSAYSRGVDYLKQDIEQRFSESGDSSCTILQNWARIEARLCRNMQKARELWDRIMTKGNAKYANMWLEYFNLERAHGDPQHCRKALHRAVQCTTDYPEHVSEVLLTFERVEGSLDDWDLAVEKTETRMNHINEWRAKAAVKDALQTKQEEEKTSQRKKARSEKKAAKKAQKQPTTGDKRKADEEEWGALPDKPNKKRRAGELEETEEAMATECGLFGRKGIAKTVETPAQQKHKAVVATRNKVPHDNSKDDLTVFVSNLAYSMHDPEDRIKEIFASFGQIADIRLVYSNRGHFRGYCYVEFKEKEAATNALKLDRQELEGRPMFISPCVDKAKNPEFKVFRYSSSLEKHKIFISGLPFSCTREDLEELCKDHGNLKEIRLVTNRSGKPKGLAYVEFENETQASLAVLKLDGNVLKDHTISVAISNPPQRKQTANVETGGTSGSFLPRQVYGPRGKGRTQLALVPRALQRLPAPGTSTENGTLREQDDNAKGDSTRAADMKKMTNADFAKMLLRK